MAFDTILDSEAEADIARIMKRPEFAVFEGMPVLAQRNPAMLEHAGSEPVMRAFWLRYGLESAWLCGRGVAAPRAALAAARASALFATGEDLNRVHRAALPQWVAPMAADLAPAAAQLEQIAGVLGFAVSWGDIARLREVWSLLGTAEALMETGGDIRLARDPHSALNGYGCSHRPRPWAVTFASSTASSSSERGYAAADAARLRASAAMLGQGARAPVRAALQEVRAALGRIYGLADDGAVVLAASGTDTELLALAITHLARPAQPILNILVAPEETGSGVPMAARGLHFAVDTARGHDVARAAPIAGFRADTQLAAVALRDAHGQVRPHAVVRAEIEAAVGEGIAAGRRVILHALDLSKTGLLAPSLDCLQSLRAAHGAKFDIVVDACQARLSPASVQNYLALDAVVLVTGSKFFTGPPFAGAALLPPAVAARFTGARLPAGLEAYFGRDEFPEICPAADFLPASGNYGLALRWHAALAEIQAFMAVALADRAAILAGFGQTVAQEIAATSALRRLPAPPITRGAADEDWERCPSIFTFSLAAPHEPQRLLTPVEARAVYLWLNADISAALPELSEAERRIAARICHIGQPVKLPLPDGGFTGVLRVSAGARLLSGEPSHGALSQETRIAQEFADLRMVFAKIRLILSHFPVLWAADPQPRYKT
jgi:hypothetical protein